MIKDNRPDFYFRVKKDYNLPDNDVVIDSILIVVANNIHCCPELYSLVERYNDLICSWCGQLHDSSKHNQMNATWQAFGIK